MDLFMFGCSTDKFSPSKPCIGVDIIATIGGCANRILANSLHRAFARKMAGATIELNR
jgi:hypothetical protein